MFERSYEIERFCAMKSSRQVLLEVVLFQSRGRGHPQSDAMPNFFLESKCSILRLSNKISFVCKFFCKSGKNLEKKKSIISPNVSNCHKLYKNEILLLPWQLSPNIPSSQVQTPVTGSIHLSKHGIPEISTKHLNSDHNLITVGWAKIHP